MASWRKVIVSGSNASLAAVTASIQLQVGTNQYITTSPSTTYLSGSFSGSFFGNGSNLTGIVATNVTVAGTDSGLVSTDFVIVSSSSGLSKITYSNLLSDLTNAADSNLEVDGSTDGIRLKSQISVTGISGSFSGSFFGNGNGLTNIPFSSLTSVPVIISSSILAPGSGQGSLTFTSNSISSGDITATGLGTGGSPTFVAVGATNASFALAATATTVTIAGSSASPTINLGNGVGSNVIIPGNLTVNGTTSIINTTNLEVKDAFILLASGSVSSNTDGGIIVQGGTQGTGSAFYWDGGENRWSVANTIASTLSGGITTPNSYVVTVSGSTTDPSGAPYYGDGANKSIGSMYINHQAGDIWIWA